MKLPSRMKIIFIFSILSIITNSLDPLSNNQQYIRIEPCDLNENKSFVFQGDIFPGKAVTFQIVKSLSLIKSERVYFSTKDTNLTVSIKYVDVRKKKENYLKGLFSTKTNQTNKIDLDVNSLISSSYMLLEVSSDSPSLNVTIDISILEAVFLEFSALDKVRFFFNLSINQKLYVLIRNFTPQENDERIFFWRTLEGSISSGKYFRVTNNKLLSPSDYINNKPSKGLSIKNNILLGQFDNMPQNEDILIELSCSFSYPIGYIYFRNLITVEENKQFSLDLNNFNILKFKDHMSLSYDQSNDSFIKIINITPIDDMLVNFKYNTKEYELNDIKERNFNCHKGNDISISTKINEEAKPNQNQDILLFIESYDKIDQDKHKVINLNSGAVKQISREKSIVKVYVKPEGISSKNSIILESSNGIFEDIRYSVHRHYTRSSDIKRYEIYDYINPNDISHDDNKYY